MKIITTIFFILISGWSYSQVEDYTVIFDQILLKLSSLEKKELEENSDIFLQQITALWPNVKNRLYTTIDWNKNQNITVRDIDLRINVLKRSIEIHNTEYTQALSHKILESLRTLRINQNNGEYPIDLLLGLGSSYNSIKKAVYDQKLDLLEWIEFQELVNKFIEDWEKYNCLTLHDLTESFPNLDEEQHEEFKNKFVICLEDFITSLQSGYRSDFEIPCDELGNALSSLTALYHFDRMTLKGL